MNGLIETCRDGELGFLTAAAHVQSPALKELFGQMSAQRARIAADLTPHAQRLGGDAAGDGTNAAALHRHWIDVKSALRRHDDHAILVEVERGDAVTLRTFEDAIGGMLPPDSRDVVERVYAELTQAHAMIASVDRARHAQT
jgi:uncharacterized protein (TIGR02284 family)